jgi:molecular chaperone GrpE
MPKSKTKKTKKVVKGQKKDIQEISKKVDELENSLAHHKEKNILLLAEFDNYKRRKIQERIDYEKYEGEKIFKEVIPIIDDVDRVLSLDGIKDQSLIDGVSLIREKFIGILSDFGVLSYDSVGEQFDPEYHEAIMMKKTKKKSNMVIEEFQKGYKYHNKVLRHSKVIVSE